MKTSITPGQIGILATLVVFSMFLIGTNLACPRMQCAPIISKCQLTDACRCDTNFNTTCFKLCSHCLGDLFPECCSCLGICPSEHETYETSHTKLFDNTSEELFDLFTADEDVLGRWTVFKEPSKINSSKACVMAFLTSCVDEAECEGSCLSLGADGYRWFHVGCCECVGKNCGNFGVNEIRCRNCPSESDRVMNSDL